MFRVTRIAVATVLALAIGALPLMLDRCAELCDAAHPTAAAEASPPCHHAAPAGTRLTSAPAPCGHDHYGPVVTAVKSVASTDRTVAFTGVAAGRTPVAVPLE